MIRTPPFRPEKETHQAWQTAIDAIAKPLVDELKTWPLYQRAGMEWPDLPTRTKPVTSLKQTVTVWMIKGSPFIMSAIAGLTAQYHNQSDMLTARAQFFSKTWQHSYQPAIVKKTVLALESLPERLVAPLKPDQREILSGRVSVLLRFAAWERLHADALESPCFEPFLPILRAGHVPAGVQGKDWGTCEYLYF